MSAEYIRELPNDIPVKIAVEKVFKQDERDSCFKLECRVCDGEFVGSKINLFFYREKKAGGPRLDTKRLLEALNPGLKAEECPSYSLADKIFETTPWHPFESKYQMFGHFKYVGMSDAY